MWERERDTFDEPFVPNRLGNEIGENNNKRNGMSNFPFEFWWAYQFNEFMHFWIYHVRRHISFASIHSHKMHKIRRYEPNFEGIDECETNIWWIFSDDFEQYEFLVSQSEAGALFCIMQNWKHSSVKGLHCILLTIYIEQKKRRNLHLNWKHNWIVFI